jgi:glycine C-acetyltransferase
MYQTLEKKLAKHKSQQNALIYPTGYMANLGVITAITQTEKKNSSHNDLILSDELNHSSIIDATKLSGVNTSIYKHNDIDDLNTKLKQKAKRKFIITEGIFSMDGDYARLKDITELMQKHNNVFLILDDAHGDFVVGKDGKGTAHHLRASKSVDVYISSLSKGLGSFGGYVTSRNNIIDLCVNTSKPFIYTSALPNIILQHAIKRFDYNREKFRKKLWRNVTYLSKGLKQIGFDIKSHTQIIPIIIGDEKKTMTFGKFMATHGVFVQPIRYPTVQLNMARIRISVSGLLDMEHLDYSLGVFDVSAKKFNLV